jgi:hypothetical protein
LFNNVGPGVANVGEVAIVGRVINEEADIVVACLIGIAMVELRMRVRTCSA